MAATRFEGAGPVARYWLAHCEGFAVQGGARGVVVELIRDADPHVTTRLVVRRRRRRLKVVPAAAVAAVVPEEKLLLVERPRRRRRPKQQRARRPLPSLPLPTLPVARLRPRARTALRHVVAFARSVARVAGPAVAVLTRSLRMLGAEARASAALLLRSRSR
jgi:hypothetical protein